MKAQSLSVVVPNQRCINDCAFCVSKMSANTYKNQMDDSVHDFGRERRGIAGDCK